MKKKLLLIGMTSIFCFSQIPSTSALTAVEQSQVSAFEGTIEDAQKKIEKLTDSEAFKGTPKEQLDKKNSEYQDRVKELESVKAERDAIKASIEECNAIINRLEPCGNRTELDETSLKQAKKDKITFQQKLCSYEEVKDLKFLDQIVIIGKRKIAKAEDKLADAKEKMDKEQAEYDAVMAEVAEYQATINEANEKISSIKGENLNKWGQTPEEEAYWKKYQEAMEKQYGASTPSSGTSADLGNSTPSGTAGEQPAANIVAPDETEDAPVVGTDGTLKPPSSAEAAVPSGSTSSPAPAAQEDEENAAPAAGTGEPYKVMPGDSLSKIAKTLLGDASRYPEIIALNKDKYPSLEKNPNLIYAGWVFDMPADPQTETASAPAQQDSKITSLQANVDSIQKAYDDLVKSGAPQAALTSCGQALQQAKNELEKAKSGTSTPSTTAISNKELQLELKTDDKYKELQSAISAAEKKFEEVQGTAGMNDLKVKNQQAVTTAKKALDDYMLKQYGVKP